MGTDRKWRRRRRSSGRLEYRVQNLNLDSRSTVAHSGGYSLSGGMQACHRFRTVQVHGDRERRGAFAQITCTVSVLWYPTVLYSTSTRVPVIIINNNELLLPLH